MKIKYYISIAVIFFGLSFSTEASLCPPGLNKPDCMKGVEKTPSSLASLPLLLKEGKLMEFYKEARKAYELEYPDLKDRNSTQRFLWLTYYISAAQLLPRDDYDDNTQAAFNDDVDLDLKQDALTQALKIARNDMDELVEVLQIKEKDLSQFFSLCSARIVHDIRHDFDPTVAEKVKEARIKMKKEAVKRKELIFKFGSDEEKQAFLFGGGEEKSRSLNLFNKGTSNENRNYKIRSILEFMEIDFVESLVKLFPGKKESVMKYIKLAGYENADAYNLIDRTVGHDGQTEFLYKNRPKYSSK